MEGGINVAYNDNMLIKITSKKLIKGNYYAINHLSPYAFYAYIFLLNVNEQFKPTMSAFMTFMNCGIKRVRSAIGELEKKGYLERRRIGYQRYQWIIRDKPDATVVALTPSVPKKVKVDNGKIEEIKKKIEEVEDRLLNDKDLHGKEYDQLWEKRLKLDEELSKYEYSRDTEKR